MLNDQPDYNADHQKPIAGTYTKEKGGSSYLRRLEDIDESWVRKYLENVLTGIKINKSGGIREYAKQHLEAQTFNDSEGEAVEEGELLVDDTDYAPMTVAEAKSKLPYLLKRLHDKSMAMRTSAISLIIAYEKAKRYTKCPRPKDILGAGVYKMGKDGNFDGLFPDSANSGKVFPPACDWIRGFDRDAYFSDAVELLRICEILGVDITKEDPLDYQAKDINKLKVTYITKNRDYLKGAPQRNLSVIASLSSAKVSDYATTNAPFVSITSKARNTIQAVLDCGEEEIRGILNSPPNHVWMNRVFSLYSQEAKDFRITKKQHMESLSSYRGREICNPDSLRVPVLSDFVTRDGFLYSLKNDSLPQLFRLGRYVDMELSSNLPAIAHCSGYFFLVTDSNCIFYLDAMELYNYMSDCRQGIFTNRYTKNHKYGRWDECFV